MPGDRVTAALLALSIALGLLVWWQGRGEPALPTVATGPAPVPAIVDGEAGIGPPLPPLATLTDTVDRPLFSPERRPPAPDSAPAPAVDDIAEVPSSQPPPLTLSAVIIERDRRQALLVPSGGGTPKRVVEGEQVDGWTLSEVREQGVTLARGDDRHELVLRTFESPPPAAAQRGVLRAPSAGRAEPARPNAAPIPVPRPRRPLRGPRRRSLERQER